ncbi:MAG: radical SAM protein [Myxococcota bacterium]
MLADDAATNPADDLTPHAAPAAPVAPTPRQILRQVRNPPNPWISTVVEHLGAPPEAELSVFVDSSRAALARNDSPDIDFRWSVNPYRGCYHGCAYCYARPSHQHLDLGAGSDFERKLIVKPEVASLLRDQLEHPRWKGELIMFSGNTDCYQPLEASWGLTHACLEVCRDYRNPVGIITKSTLIERDVELIAEMAREGHAGITVSILWDADGARHRALRAHARAPHEDAAAPGRAGIPVGKVNVAPIIPGLNDGDIPAILEAARRDAGAQVGAPHPPAA